MAPNGGIANGGIANGLLATTPTCYQLGLYNNGGRGVEDPSARGLHPLTDPTKDLRIGPNAIPLADCTMDHVVIELARVDLVGLIESPFPSTGSPLNLEMMAVPGTVQMRLLLGRPFGSTSQAGASRGP